jgi:hypothetical protein
MYRTISRRFTLPALLFLFTLGVYLIGLRYQGAGDTVPAELLPIALIHHHGFDLSEFLSRPDIVGASGELPYWLIRVNGHVVSMYSVIPGLLNLPVYAVAQTLGVDLLSRRFRLSLLTSAFISALSVAFMYLALRGIASRRRTALLFALVYAFATCVWSVTSRGLWEHGPSLLFITIALSLLTSGKKVPLPLLRRPAQIEHRCPSVFIGGFILKENRARLAFAGFWLGLAVATRLTNLVLVLPVVLFLLFRRRSRIIPFLALMAMPLLLLVWYSLGYWGSLLPLGGTRHDVGFRGNLFTGLAGLLFSPNRGLFVFTPVFLFAFGSLLFPLFRRRTEPLLRALAVSPILLILVYAKWSMWWGGHSFGYRLLIETIPFLVIFLTLAWERWIWPQRTLRWVFALLLLISIYFQFLGAYYYPSDFNTTPASIDQQAWRLWSISRSELVLCTRNFLHDLTRADL